MPGFGTSPGFFTNGVEELGELTGGEQLPLDLPTGTSQWVSAAVLAAYVNSLAEWQAGPVDVVGSGLVLSGGTLSATAVGGGVWAPLVDGQIPPDFIQLPDGTLVMVQQG